MARKKPKENRICIVETFANIDMHVKLVKKHIIKKDSFTEEYVCWDAIPMYCISNDKKYINEKKLLRGKCVPVDYETDDLLCIVFDHQIKKVI
mgnify:CR=1 FL=1